MQTETLLRAAVGSFSGSQTVEKQDRPGRLSSRNGERQIGMKRAGRVKSATVFRLPIDLPKRKR